MASKLAVHNHADQKVDIWNSFVDSELPDVTDYDFSILPRVLPASYLPTLRRSAYLVTKFCLKLLSLPENEIRAIVPKGPIRDHLLDELEVLRFRRGRITGSFRFDMAVVGPPDDRSAAIESPSSVGKATLARPRTWHRSCILLPHA